MIKYLKVLALVGLMCGSAACTPTHKAEVKAATTAFVDCAKTKIVPALISDVAQLLLAGAPDWQSNLEGLGKTSGSDALACAVKTVEDLFSASANGSGKSSAEKSPAAIRAEQTIAAHGWRY